MARPCLDSCSVRATQGASLHGSSEDRLSASDDSNRWSLEESVYLFVLALERWLELALSFAYQDVEPEEDGANEGDQRAEQEKVAEGEGGQ